MSETSMFQGESKPSIDMGATITTTTTDDQGSLSLIEKWLFDDQGLVQCGENQEDHIDV